MDVKQLKEYYKGWKFSYDLEEQKTHNAFLGALAYYADAIQGLERITAAIETGTHDGRSTIFLAQAFQSVFTVELEVTPERTARYAEIKNLHPHVHFLTGASPDPVKDVLQNNPDQRFLFILDAHSGYTSPLREELQTIKQYSNIKNHVIIIDDGEDIGQGTYPTFDEVIQLLEDINPSYQLYDPSIARRMLIAFA